MAASGKLTQQFLQKILGEPNESKNFSTLDDLQVMHSIEVTENNSRLGHR
jgi:hypothetical protein